MPHSDHILTNSKAFVSKRRNVTLCEQTYVLTNNNKNNDKLCITGRLCFFALTQPTLDGGVAGEHILFELFSLPFSPLADSFSLGMTTASPPTTAADKTPTLQSRRHSPGQPALANCKKQLSNSSRDTFRSPTSKFCRSQSDQISAPVPPQDSPRGGALMPRQVRAAVVTEYQTEAA